MGSSIPKGLVAGTSPFARAPQGSVVTIYTSEGPSQPTNKGKPDPKPTITIEPPPDQKPTKPPPPKPNSTATADQPSA